MAKLKPSELYVKDAKGRYHALGIIETGVIKLANGKILEIGNVEDRFDMMLTDEDKALLACLEIGEGKL